MKQISVRTFKEVLDQSGRDAHTDFINVCSPAEYNEKHIVGVRSVPLDTLASHIDEFKDKKTIYIHCRSGNRGRQAIEKLAALGVSAELVNVEGGILSWEEAGFETGSTTSRLPLMRQVFIAAGALVLMGVLLTYFVHPHFILLPLFVSCGLLFSGFTGWCGMAYLLGKMPWNK